MRNKAILYVVIATLGCAFLSSCIDRDKYAPKPYVRALEIVKISDSEYMHITYLKDGKGGYIGCNGYIYIDTNEALIFDTPINDSLSQQLITFVQEDLKATVKGVVVNHRHIDASGGLKTFHKNEIASYASAKTAVILAKDSLYITNPFEQKQEIKVGNTMVENRYFGEAHTSDNIVSYIPTSKTVVGGCMVKCLDGVRGNVSDANLDSWPETIAKIKTAYPDMERVIPGHGGYGDTSLLDYTIAMFAKEEVEIAPSLNLE